LTLQSTKILGGADNDGVMNFNRAAGVDIMSAVASTINGSKGVDNITIGVVTTASGFEVRGGAGDDTISSINTGADGILYAGDLGDDNILITAGDGDASILVVKALTLSTSLVQLVITPSMVVLVPTSSLTLLVTTL
jgi:Ca2+-binding RTX toxin-like protein